ncbi:unnamed protein product [Leptidea sinapis]|uniref:Major facilitator superfamily (MFS) profile domain-containing protein n=1 Tax=Leptidea sinapis TaxID=189913 RepID=A0A5E4PYF0_9NEOP|nr:unnamed protein product [Leptidea sinapis]
MIFLVGKWSIAMVSSSVYLYTMELYPTKYRHSLFAFSSMMGRIGSIIAPLTPAFDKVASSNGEGRNKISLETLLVEEIGQFGRYQCRMVGVTIIFIIFASWPAVEYLFTTAQWILNAVPESGASFHDCSRFSPSNVTRVSDADTCPAYRFQRDKIIACEDFVYETTYSVVYDGLSGPSDP